MKNNNITRAQFLNSLAAAAVAAGLSACGTAPEQSAASAGSQPFDAPLVPLQPDAPDLLDYDEIRVILDCIYLPCVQTTGYYTVSRGGKWGLMTHDGEELLPCLADEPVLCGDHENEFYWNYTTDLPNSTIKELEQKLAAHGLVLSWGHCITGYICYWDAISSRPMVFMDDYESNFYSRTATDQYFYQPMNEEDIRLLGNRMFLRTAEPVYSYCYENEFCEPVSTLTLVRELSDFVPSTLYDCAVQAGTGSGTAFAAEDVQNFGWFYGENAAPVQLGSNWAYMTHTTLCSTDPVYEPVLCSLGSTHADTANSLRLGHAAVLRDGKWGLINDALEEVVPCAHDGCAWTVDPSVTEGYLWLKKNGRWSRFRLGE